MYNGIVDWLTIWFSGKWSIRSVNNMVKWEMEYSLCEQYGLVKDWKMDVNMLLELELLLYGQFILHKVFKKVCLISKHGVKGTAMFRKCDYYM